MLTAVAKIGSLVQDSESIQGVKQGYIVTIVLDESYGLNKEAVQLEQFQPEKIPRYLYKEGESKGNNPVPIAQITTPEKTFKKILMWFDKCEKLQDITEQERNTIRLIGNSLENNKDLILSEVMEKLSNIPKKDAKTTSIFLTVKLKDNKGTDKYLGDIELFRKAYISIQKEKLGKSSAESEACCSICGEIKNNITARTFVYNFDTDDKPGFISGFDKKNFWKNIPVCEECRELLNKGRKFIDSKLTFKFYGLKYQLIPYSVLGDDDVLRETLDVFSDTYKDVLLKNRILKRLTDEEKEILELLAEKEDKIALNFLFLRSEQSAERILLLIEDVLPSRLRRIFAAKEAIDELFGEDFNFGKIRTFFKKSDEQKNINDLDKYFLEIVNAVFKGKALDYGFLLKFFMQNIRTEFSKDGLYTRRTIESLMCVNFFEKLGILNFEEVFMEQGVFERIFEKYGKSLNTPAKRGIFLLGALTQMLLNKQYSERGSKPFMKKLKGLKMDEKDIKSLVPQVINKLEEYGAYDRGKQLIAREASKYLLEASENWKMSVDEINYYFVCGMSLSDKVEEVVYSSRNYSENNTEQN